MKFSECNTRQKKAWKNARHAASDYIFGLQNTCLDNAPESEEYQSAFEALNNLEDLIETVYCETITNVYDEGFCAFGVDAEAFIKDVRFCGKDFIIRLVKKYCKAFQAEALSGVA